MTYEEFEQFFYQLRDSADKEFGAESDYLSNLIDELKENNVDNLSDEMIFSIALHDSQKMHTEMLILNSAKKLLEN